MSVTLLKAQCFDDKNHQIRILPVVLYVCEIWSLTVKEDYRLRASENRVMRMIGHKRDELTGDGRELCNK
jgi:hypothetical protein